MEQKEKLLTRIFLWGSIALIVLAAVIVAIGYFNGDLKDAESLQAYIQSFGVFGPLALTFVQAAQVVVPVLPGFLGCIVGSGLFGILGGFLCNYIGISVGSILAFYLAKRFGVTFVKKMISEKRYDKYVAWITKKKHYTLVLWLAILLPLAPDDFLCYFSGLADYPALKFIWIIILAKPWCILAYSIFFANIF